MLKADSKANKGLGCESTKNKPQMSQSPKLTKKYSNNHSYVGGEL